MHRIYTHGLQSSLCSPFFLYYTSCFFFQVQKPPLKWEMAIICELHSRLCSSNLKFGVSVSMHMRMPIDVRVQYTECHTIGRDGGDM